MKKVIGVITKNFGFKILAVIFAIFFWMIIVNVNDPDISKQFSVAATIENEEVIENMGKVYEVLDDSDIAVFTVSGSRSVIEELSASDFTVTADMSQIQGMSLVPIEVSAQRYANRITITKVNQNMQVSVEDALSEQFVISAETTGTPADGYAVESVSVSPNVITVSGAESVVSQIKSVTATINVGNVSTDVTDKVAPVFYDEDGNVVDSDNLTLNRKKVKITATLTSKSEVPVVYETNETPQDGYVISSILCSPEKVALTGDSSILEGLEQISIPQSAIDVSSLTKETSFDIDITNYLPEGVSLEDSDDSIVTVIVSIDAMQEKSITIDSDNIEISNLDSDYELSFEDDNYKFSIQGSKEQLSALSDEDITVSIDASGLEDGSHSVKVSIDLGQSQCSVVSSPSITVVLKKIDQDEDAQQDSSQDTDEDNNT